MKGMRRKQVEKTGEEQKMGTTFSLHPHQLHSICMIIVTMNTSLMHAQMQVSSSIGEKRMVGSRNHLQVVRRFPAVHHPHEALYQIL